MIDHGRHRAAERRALERWTPADPRAEEPCACVGDVIAGMRPEYAEALREVELGGVRAVVFARRKGITANNAGVRVFRARRALKEGLEHTCGACAGCFACTRGD